MDRLGRPRRSLAGRRGRRRLCHLRLAEPGGGYPAGHPRSGDGGLLRRRPVAAPPLGRYRHQPARRRRRSRPGRRVAAALRRWSAQPVVVGALVRRRVGRALGDGRVAAREALRRQRGHRPDRVVVVARHRTLLAARCPGRHPDDRGPHLDAGRASCAARRGSSRSVSSSASRVRGWPPAPRWSAIVGGLVDPGWSAVIAALVIAVTATAALELQKVVDGAWVREASVVALLPVPVAFLSLPATGPVWPAIVLMVVAGAALPVPERMARGHSSCRRRAGHAAGRAGHAGATGLRRRRPLDRRHRVVAGARNARCGGRLSAAADGPAPFREGHAEYMPGDARRRLAGPLRRIGAAGRGPGRGRAPHGRRTAVRRGPHTAGGRGRGGLAGLDGRAQQGRAVGRRSRRRSRSWSY